jgi:NADPH:quinone reductase-like Zn-dependent oxidoreductase
MRAVVHDRYGAPDVLRVERVERPAPAPHEVLVRVRAAAVSRTDCGFRGGKPAIMRLGTGVRAPRHRILGSDFAGEVAAVGGEVTRFAVGDPVFGTRFGAHAEFVCVREQGVIARLPERLSFEEGAAVCDGALKALVLLNVVQPLTGKRLVVYGASGAIGTAAVQLAEHFGAHVTAVCNAQNLELARSLGAERVVDYARDDFASRGERYDVIVDAVGKRSYLSCRRALAHRGHYLTTDGGLLWHALPLALLHPRVHLPVTPASQRDLLFVSELIEAGEFRPVVDRTYPLEDVVEATRYVETEQKVGNVVLVG